MTFEEKVKSMTGKQIMQAMIDGLNKPWVTVNMDTYGDVDIVRYGFLKLWKKEVCFGCAATNTICEINNAAFPLDQIDKLALRANFLKGDYDFLYSFELALDYLRQGNVRAYNNHAQDIDIAQIPELDMNLPILNTENYKNNLVHYQNYCDAINENTDEKKDN